MVHKTAALALCAALMGLPAFAQTEAPPPVLDSPPAELDGGAAPNGTGPADRDDRGRDDRAERRGPGMAGVDENGRHGWMRGERGGPHGMRPARMPEAGFRIRLGEGVDLEVRCGETAFAECMESARPLLEQLER